METTKQEEEEVQPHVIIVPSPGRGHLIPLTEFAKRLVLHHHFFVTFIIPSGSDDNTTSSTTTRKALPESLPNSIKSTYLPPVDISDLPECTQLEVRISLTVTRSLPALQNELIKLSSTRVSAVVVDLFGLSAIDLVKEFGIPVYIFYPSTAMCLSLVLHMPELDKTFSGEYRELSEPIKLPGCVPLFGKDFMDTAQDRNSKAYKGLMQRWKEYDLAGGVLINSFMDLEFGALKALKEENGLLKPPIFPIGPLVQVISDCNDRSDCLKWLDGQPKGSVLYVSFGSGGTLSRTQLIELAYGLEMSEQRFLWVLKSPNEKEKNAEFFNIKSVENPTDFLPEGFLERTNGKGIVVPSWAPQIEILSHGSTGGFLTHCGWNSILESIVHGVIMIAWPLYAEQKMNAVLVTEDLGVAWRVKVSQSGLVLREEIAKMARCLIEGEERNQLGNRMNELKEAAAKALREDGSSAKAIFEVAQKLSCFHVEN